MKYYVWIFSISVANSGRYTNYTFGDAVAKVTTSGSAGGFIYIDNGTSFDKYQIYIDNGSSWDLYAPYIDNGSSWELYGG